MKVLSLISRQYGCNTYYNRKINMHGIEDQGGKMATTIKDLIINVLERVKNEISAENKLPQEIIEIIENDYAWRDAQKIGLKISQSTNGLIFEKIAKNEAPSERISRRVESGISPGKTMLTKNDIIAQLQHSDLLSELENWRSVDISSES